MSLGLDHCCPVWWVSICGGVASCCPDQFTQQLHVKCKVCPRQSILVGYLCPLVKTAVIQTRWEMASVGLVTKLQNGESIVAPFHYDHWHLFMLSDRQRIYWLRPHDLRSRLWKKGVVLSLAQELKTLMIITPPWPCTANILSCCKWSVPVTPPWCYTDVTLISGVARE